MAEKGFGVKEINLIGASGTPTIESPNNLNLNAVNVAISTNVSIGGTLTVTGNISAGGTVTYEDVTNVDSIGIITARQGVRINADSANPAGASATNYLSVGASQDLKLYHNGNQNYISAPDGTLIIQADNIMHVSDDTGGRSIYQDNANSRLELGFDGTAAAYVSSSNVQFVKPITANTDGQHDIGTNSVRFRNAYVDTYYGSGANLTGIAVTEAPVVDYTITSNGASAYRFHGGGVDETADDPDLYLIRGQKYRFNNTTGTGHPFRFTSTGNKNDTYSNGVTGDEDGVQFWTIPYDAPAKLFYVCTLHPGMVGNIYIRGAGGQNDNVGLTTFSNGINVSGGVLDVATYIRKSSGTLGHYAASHSFVSVDGTSEYVTIDSGGRLLVGTTSHQSVYGTSALQVAGTTGATSSMSLVRHGNSPYLTLGSSGGSSLGAVTALADDARIGQITFAGADGTDINTHSASIAAYVDGSVSSNTVPGRLTFQTSTGASEITRMTITSAGQVRIGNSNNLSLWGQNNRLQVAGTDWNTSGVTIACMGSGGSANLVLGNSRASTPGGSGGALVQDSRIGYISFVGDDGTDMATVGAAIVAECDSNASSNSIPGRLRFYTGGNSNERLRITSTGYVHFGNTGHGTNKVGGQNITGQDYDPYLKILANTSNHWLMQARSDSTSGNGIFLRSGNSSSTYTLYATGYDENNLHLSVRGDGVIQSPKQVGCAVRMSSNQSHPGNNSFENSSSIMNFDTEVWDIGNNFNGTAKTFTAPVAGRYLCCYTIQIESISNWLWLYIYPVVNGSNTQTQAKGVVYADMAGTGVTGNSTTTAAYQMFSNTVIMNLAADDEVTLRTRGQISGTIKSGAETQWTMQLLG